MKIVMVIIKLFKLDEVCEVLIVVGIQGLIVIEVKGYGCQKGYIEIYCGIEYVVSFLLKLKIEVVVGFDFVDKVVEVIVLGVKIGQIGDGKVFVYLIDYVVCICIGEIDFEVF